MAIIASYWSINLRPQLDIYISSAPIPFDEQDHVNVHYLPNVIIDTGFSGQLFLSREMADDVYGLEQISDPVHFSTASSDILSGIRYRAFIKISNTSQEIVAFAPIERYRGSFLIGCRLLRNRCISLLLKDPSIKDAGICTQVD